uniref:RWD domain-containing protein n=2 Tax=Meloidogyne enterolobii TaxID=390850 RepID=A0A6V7X437_MELEN|nr:unnamed protein product [Meloidogyne enterolobii]
MNNQFDESVQLEIESILAIFPKEVFIESNSRIIVEYENNAHLHIRLPLDYPKNPPLFELVSPALSSENRKELLTILNKFCSENNGEQILYSLIQCFMEYFCDLGEKEKEKQKIIEKEEGNDLTINIPLPSNFYSGKAIEDRKSVFQGHVTKLDSKDKVPKLLESLKTVGKIARARHNPYAWRIVNDAKRAIEQHDCDDDGETGSASKLLRLLMQMDAKDVLLVVSRWKGGNKIGPDRFRHICNAGRDALISGGFVVVKGEGEKNI